MSMKIYYCILLCYFLKKNEPRLLFRIVISNTSVMTFNYLFYCFISSSADLVKSISMVNITIIGIDVSMYVRIDMQAAESDSNTYHIIHIT